MLDRQEFIDSIDTMLGRDGLLAMLIVKIMRLDDVNAVYGVRTGDEYLMTLGARLNEILRKVDLVARIGDSEFGVLLPSIHNASHAILAVNKVLSEFGHPVVCDSRMLSPVVVIGVAVATERDQSPYDLLNKASIAVKQAQKDKSDYAVYSPEAERVLPPNLVLEHEIKEAFDNEELDVYFQPKIDLKRQCLIGAEALIRWVSPKYGQVDTQHFVNVLEHSDILIDVTKWVLNRAVRHCAECSVGDNTSSVAVNLSPALLTNPAIVDLASNAVNIWGLDPSRLVLEVTEGAMMCDPGASRFILEKFTSIGMMVSIDDFGTGYSSMSYLKDLPLDELKIDKTFVINMMENEKDRSIVKATIDLAHTLGLTVVAEGIENAETLDTLVRMGCDEGQGYYIGKPMRIDNFNEWVRDSGWAPDSARKHAAGSAGE